MFKIKQQQSTKHLENISSDAFIILRIGGMSMNMEEMTDNKSIANQINIEAMTISTLASSLKTEHGVNIQYDAIIQATNRLFDLADYIKNNNILK